MARVQVVQDALDKIWIVKFFVGVFGEHASEEPRVTCYSGHNLLHLAVVSREEELGLITIIDTQHFLLNLAIEPQRILILIIQLNKLHSLPSKLSYTLNNLLLLYTYKQIGVYMYQPVAQILPLSGLSRASRGLLCYCKLGPSLKLGGNFCAFFAKWVIIGRSIIIIAWDRDYHIIGFIIIILSCHLIL